MGQSVACLRNRFSNKKPIKVLIDGLNYAGKTTLLYRWILGEAAVETIPTIGFNVESLEYKDFRFTFWDAGGGDKIRPLRRHYYPGIKVLIFVVDSTDAELFSEVKDELAKAMEDDLLKDVILLVFANKQDLPNAVSAGELSKRIGLQSLQNKRWCIQASCARSGDGIYEGLDWLCKELSNSPEFKSRCSL